MHTERDWRATSFETRAIHAGQEPDPTTGAVIVPIYQTSTFAQEAVGVHKGYEYARTDNPTRSALQEAVAALEEGAWGLAYASGLAATQNLAYLLAPGDHVLLSDDAYGGTYRLFAKVHRALRHRRRAGRPFRPRGGPSGAAARDQIRLGRDADQPLPEDRRHRRRRRVAAGPPAMLVVDNTFASPYLQRPLTLGADLVLHSTTKYLGGHSDVVGGMVVGNDRGVFDTLKFHQNAAGAVPGPFDCWVALRGIKTLAVRMERHSANAQAVAEFLQRQEAVEEVYYPGLPDHPGHEVAARQMSGFSGMVSFTLRGGYEAASAVAAATRVFLLAESLGGVESLIEHPGVMTHASVAGTKGEVAPNLLRLSVGIEGLGDLIEDLERALAAVPVAAAR
jgi:cystathionine beta-lyase/cystathionine gamma-synthase